MDTKFQSEPHSSVPVRTGSEEFGEWLTVAEAVAYCSLSGLDRTPKTVRKWAHRSHREPENADLIVRREDVDNGFRWTIERTSLDRKIAQELEFEARRIGESVSTGADASGGVHTGAAAETNEFSPDDAREAVRTGAHRSEPERGADRVIDELRERIEDLKGEVEFYRDELRDRRHTTLALTDVIEAFRLTAQSNASRSERESKRSANQHRIVVEGDNSNHDVDTGAV